MHTAMQATSSGAADADATVNSSGGNADVDGSDGAAERMERTVAAEQQDRSGNHHQQEPLQPQQQQTSLSPSAVLGECHACRGRSHAYWCSLCVAASGWMMHLQYGAVTDN